VICSWSFFFLVFLFVLLARHLLGMNFFTICSGSMSPVIPVGSVVVVEPVTASEIEVGDIIAYTLPWGQQNTVAHRVIGITPSDGSLGFRTLGDASASPDEYAVPAQDVIGRVRFHVPLLGYLSSFVRTELGFVLLVVTPAILIVSWSGQRVITEVKHRNGQYNINHH